MFKIKRDNEEKNSEALEAFYKDRLKKEIKKSKAESTIFMMSQSLQ